MRNSGLRWLWIAAMVLILDRMTKWLVQKYVAANWVQPVMPGLNLILSYNKGAAFGFLNNNSSWQIWFLSAVAILVIAGILIVLSRLSGREAWLGVALSFIVGGALGNLLDRIMQGQVTDFIQVYVSHFYWPAFNVADSAICAGAVMLIGKGFFKKNK
jgi:signal peptidase II